ncbi:hypothetical protein QTO34_002345 [Cnephaeus nilssonii]|uniref:WAP domain-containing protein n=1 Tax=Cnephaeus nilssonii TaxID=3371016 RepID=A0AA40LMP7_CNENI|nr:hypothetical protein QTO34_002345 [Eptesicus nilssonii]
MRAWNLLLLVALLALGSQLPAVSGRRKGERHGGCPPDDGPCLLSVPDQCVDDSQCPSKMKCCHKSCFRQCVRRVTVKQGTCPEDRLRCLSPIQHLCHRTQTAGAAAGAASVPAAGTAGTPSEVCPVCQAGSSLSEPQL